MNGQTYMVPSRADAIEAMKVAEDFVTFVMQRVRPELRKEMEFVLEQPQLGYNTLKRVYSVPFPATPFQSCMTGERGQPDSESPAGGARASGEAAPRSQPPVEAPSDSK